MTEKKLLVPVDYSEESRHALEYALMLARGLHRDVDVLYVWELMPHPSPDMSVRTPEGKTRSLLELIHENAEIEMSDFLAKTDVPEGVHLGHRVLSGEPSRRILEAAESGEY